MSLVDKLFLQPKKVNPRVYRPSNIPQSSKKSEEKEEVDELILLVQEKMKV